MQEKDQNEKGTLGVMNTQDFLMNKPLLREINSKLKVSQYEESLRSVKSGQQPVELNMWSIFKNNERALKNPREAQRILKNGLFWLLDLIRNR